MEITVTSNMMQFPLHQLSPQERTLQGYIINGDNCYNGNHSNSFHHFLIHDNLYGGFL